MSDDLTQMFESSIKQGQYTPHAFIPAMEKIDTKAFEKVFLALSGKMMKLWFAKTFNAEGLGTPTRLFLAIAAITVLGVGAEPQLCVTIRHAVAAGSDPPGSGGSDLSNGHVWRPARYE
jgi:4-carboxymuconolactone decarboxylase